MPEKLPESMQSAPVAPRSSKQSDPAVILEFAVNAARLLFDDKCEDVVVLDVRNKSMVSDYIIIGSGTSDRQMASVLDHVEDLGAKTGFGVFHTSKDDNATWLLADFVDIVVHLFEPNVRAHYDIETLWGDAPRVDWERPDQRRRDHAGLGG
jgi:ribosome-associated protein